MRELNFVDTSTSVETKKKMYDNAIINVMISAFASNINSLYS